MNSFRKQLLWLSVILIVILAISGCTRKHNLTGNNWSNVNTKTVDDAAGIIDGFSYPADTLRVITGSETMLLTGDYLGNQAVAYMRFTGLPRQATVAVIDADSCYVNLMLTKRSPLAAGTLKLRLYKVNEAWSDTLSHMDNMDYINGTEVDVPDSVSLLGKVVKLKLDNNAVKNWETGADSTGYNLAVKVVGSGFVELRSADSVISPALKLRFKDTDDTEFQVMNLTPASDSYTITGVQDAVSAAWKIDDIKATRIYIKWVPTNSLFTNNDGVQLSSEDIKRLTVNRAIIVLHAKPDSYYANGSGYSLFGFNNIRAGVTITSPPLLADYQIINTPEGYIPSSSTGALVGDSLYVDITTLVQAFVSGEKLPLGVMIQSTYERQDFGNVEFYDFSAATPAAKKPYIRITYTPPYLKQ